MLKYLHIENIAVIEKSDIEFTDGFNVLTGETGAGKSIVIDAINAVLGERTSKSIIRTGAAKAVVNAQFCDLGSNVLRILAENSYSPDEDGNLIIQRVLSADGNGSIKINGQPVTAAVLRSFAPLLVNIHGQHDSQLLLNPDKHYSFVDMMADNALVLQQYLDQFKRYRSINSEILAFSIDEKQKNDRIDLLKYQIDELTCAALKSGEEEQLKQRSAVYRNYDKLIRSVSAALGALGGDETAGAVEMVNDARAALENSSVKEFEETALRLSALYIELDQIRNELDGFIGGFDYDAAEVDTTEKRLAFLHDLFAKYGGSEEAAMEYLANARKELEDISFSDERIAELENELEKCSEALVKCGEAVTASRKTAALQFEAAVRDVLIYLDMPYVTFKVDFQKGKYTQNGCDIIEFLISANPGEEPRPLSKIASGGELSRIMLAIKSVLADKDTIGTLIFDEIDTGVSGRAAQKVGYQLRKVAGGRQVLCVTHLAQIAAKADTHLYIEKKVAGGRTLTEIRKLDFEGRKYELARIIGGETTDLNLKSAEEMLNN